MLPDSFDATPSTASDIGTPAAAIAGAGVLGLDAVGSIEVGKAADLVLYDIDDPRFYGFHDLAVAPVTAGEPARVRYNIVNGRVVVDDGVIPGLDIDALRREAAEGVKVLLAD